MCAPSIGVNTHAVGETLNRIPGFESGAPRFPEEFG